MASMLDDPESSSDRQKFNHADGGAADPTYDERIKVFEDWLLANGSEFPKLTMQKYDDEVRGVHARETIGPDEVIVEVPLSCLITVEMGKETSVGRAVMAADLELDAPKHVFLMLFMLIDRKAENSHFKPYYDILPETLSNMPIFWSQEELALLQGSYLLTQIEDRNRAIETDYNAICELCPGFADIATLEDFKWARMCVCSRNFGITVDGVRTSAMVPYADMLNHYRPRETKWSYEQTRRAFTITSLQSIREGAQVYDSYGQKCNHRFLLNYGFSIENNVEADGFCPNEVPFFFTLNPADRLFDKKLRFWMLDDHRTKMIRVCVSENEGTAFALACLRVIVATEDEFETIINSSIHGRRAGPMMVRDVRFPLTLRNERAAMLLLSGMIDDMLSAYPTTLEEDRARLAGRSLKPFSNERHAIIQVVGEKEVLHHYKKHCETALHLMDIDVFDDATYMDKMREMDKDGVSPYILRYCAPDPHGIIGSCRRVERRMRQHAESALRADPTKPHIV